MGIVERICSPSDRLQICRLHSADVVESRPAEVSPSISYASPLQPEQAKFLSPPDRHLPPSNLSTPPAQGLSSSIAGSQVAASHLQSMAILDMDSAEEFFDATQEQMSDISDVRSKAFPIDGSRVPGGEPLLRLVAVDWLRSNSRIDHVAKRPANLVQKHSTETSPFIFLVNLQVPGTTHYSLVFYWVAEYPVPENSLFHVFMNEDDTFRNSRFTLIPSIAEGSWIVKQAVGSRPVPLGSVLELTYLSGKNYFEVN
ncbi:hypothetical protein CBR_g29261 [Chara braunii]|uniref:Protein ENHANCED DISEASE RESISTANCE 2 C-terminal domain-containing protein n=1 Tax=Chara braunii TaxID=69332 RepID=A0A388LA76_CHABU|nr:hypothetical protein CBR_g29261 [Chara braunii]|eukprot:GBG79210.1 hypothetical protein CBR_g29261 [Chara braunii]